MLLLRSTTTPRSYCVKIEIKRATDCFLNANSRVCVNSSLHAATLTEHIRHIRVAGDYSNNKMERMNGEIRDADSFKVLSSFG